MTKPTQQETTKLLVKNQQKQEPFSYLSAFMRRDCETTEQIKFYIGTILFMIVGPYVILQIAMCQLWDFLDSKFLKFIPLIKFLTNKYAHHFDFMMKSKGDGFAFCLMVFLGVIQPMHFFYELNYAMEHGVEWKRIVFYNIIRYCHYFVFYFRGCSCPS